MTPLPEISLDFAGADQLPWSVVHWHLTEALSALYTCTLVLSLPDGGADPDALLEAHATRTVTRAGLTRHLRGVVREVDDLGATASSRFARVITIHALWRVPTHHFASRISEIVVAVGRRLRTSGTSRVELEAG